MSDPSVVVVTNGRRLEAAMLLAQHLGVGRVGLLVLGGCAEAVPGNLVAVEARPGSPGPGLDELARRLEVERWAGVVWAHVPDPGVEAPLAETSPAAWAAGAEEPLTAFLSLLRCLRPRLEPGGRLVLLVPSEVLSGAAGEAAWTAAAEGQRSLLRVAARTWRTSGFTGHCVAVPAGLLRGPEGAPPVRRAPTAGDGLTMAHHVAGVVRTMLGSSWSAVTGDTVAVDGGAWMAP